MKFCRIISAVGLLLATAYGQIDTNASHFWMMTCFNGQGGDATDVLGAWVAFSSDPTGMNWTNYNNAQVIITPITVPGASDHKMRDPMMTYDSLNNKFTLIWTVAWTGRTIGYSTSSNLKDWGPQLGIQLGSQIPNCYLCWAPEVIWDEFAGQWMIYWSTCQGSAGDKRIYYTHVNGPLGSMDTSAKGYSTPVMMFNPGFTVIDADIMKDNDSRYIMVFKDERNPSGTVKSKNIHYVTASKPTGPWAGPNGKAMSAAISANSVGTSTVATEGPCIVKQGGEYHVFFDPYSGVQTYRMAKSTTLTDTLSPWTNAGVLKQPDGTNFTYSHSNIIEVPRRYVMSMLYGKTLPPPPGAPTLTGPVNGQVDVPANTNLLGWSQVSGATGYNVQFSTSSDFAAIAQSASAATNSATVPLHANTTYYWRVNSSTAAAGSGTWSQVWSFSTEHSATLPVKRVNATASELSVHDNVLAYTINKSGTVAISFKDMLGRSTMVLNRSVSAGRYSVSLKGYNLAAGRYIVSLRMAGVEKCAVVVLTK